jgi:hypothetical protein
LHRTLQFGIAVVSADIAVAVTIIARYLGVEWLYWKVKASQQMKGCLAGRLRMAYAVRNMKSGLVDRIL